MTVDFGLISIFAIEIGLVFAVYHALTKVWAETKAAKELKSDLTAGIARLDSFAVANKEHKEEMARWAAEVANAPAAAVRRVKEAEDELAALRRLVDKVDGKINSVNARLAAGSRKRGRKEEEEEEEKDPAAQAEGSEGLGPLFPPGSIPPTPVEAPQPWYKKKVGG